MTKTFDLGLRRHMSWDFFIAIPYLILETDVLRQFDLIPILNVKDWLITSPDCMSTAPFENRIATALVLLILHMTMPTYLQTFHAS